MGYKTFDYRCGDCEFTETLLLDRDEQESKLTAQCPQCDGIMVRVPWINTTKASFIDGNNRFAEHKEIRKIDKEFKKARRNKDRTVMAAANKEKAERIERSK